MIVLWPGRDACRPGVRLTPGEEVQPQRRLDLLQRLLADLMRAAGAVLQDARQLAFIGDEFGAAGADRLKQALQTILQQPFDFHVPQPAAPIVRLQIRHQRGVFAEGVGR